MSKKLLGEEHPSVARSINNLAKLYYSQGKYEKARPLYEEALVIAEKVLGENHPHTKKIRENYQDLQNRL